MGQITERTIGVVGGSSFRITLPKGWLRFHHLRAGDKVLVTTNGKLVVRPMNRWKGNAGDDPSLSQVVKDMEKAQR